MKYSYSFVIEIASSQEQVRLLSDIERLLKSWSKRHNLTISNTECRGQRTWVSMTDSQRNALKLTVELTANTGYFMRHLSGCLMFERAACDCGLLRLEQRLEDLRSSCLRLLDVDVDSTLGGCR